MKVMVCQRPCGTLAGRRWPRGAQPRSGAILVLVQVSSMKTRREGYGSGRPSIGRAGAPHRGDRARWRSASFFMTELLVVDEPPDRAIVDLQPALPQLGHQAAQGKITLPAALQ